AAPPDRCLFLAVPGSRFRLVQPLQRPVVTLVEPPALDRRDPELVELVERDPAGAERALEDRGVGDVEPVALVAEQAAGGVGLFESPGAEVDVGPASEAVFVIPGALAVAEQDNFVHLRHLVLWSPGPAVPGDGLMTTA